LLDSIAKETGFAKGWEVAAKDWLLKLESLTEEIYTAVQVKRLAAQFVSNNQVAGKGVEIEEESAAATTSSNSASSTRLEVVSRTPKTSDDISFGAWYESRGRTQIGESIRKTLMLCSESSISILAKEFWNSKTKMEQKVCFSYIPPCAFIFIHNRSTRSTGEPCI
jgi:hypothetical protein